MKILQVISGLGNGGAEKFVVELSNQLSDEHEVLLCSFKPVEGWMPFPKLLKQDVELRSFHKKKGFDFSIYTKLWKLIKAQQPDVVHFHLDATIKYIFPLILFFSKIKFIYTIHSDLNRHKKKIFSQLSRVLFITKKVTWVCIAPVIRTEFEQAFPSLTFQMIDNGMSELQTTPLLEDVSKEIASMKQDAQTRVFVSVAKLNDNKNQILLMEAMKELETKNVIAVLIGHDASADQHYLKKLQVVNSGNVFILGSKSNVADYLACADAFVMTSLNEGLPISALEAFAFGLPVISTPAGGLKNLVEHTKNGFVAKDFSREGLVACMQKYLDLDEQQKNRIGKGNRQVFLEHYTMKTCASRYEALYRMN